MSYTEPPLMSYLRSERCRESQDWGRQRTLTIGATTSRHFTNHYFLDVLITVKSWNDDLLWQFCDTGSLSWGTDLLKHDLISNCRRGMCRSSLSGRRTRLKTPTSSSSTIFPTSNRYWKKRHSVDEGQMTNLYLKVEQLRAEKLEIDQQLRTFQHSGQGEGRVRIEWHDL